MRTAKVNKVERECVINGGCVLELTACVRRLEWMEMNEKVVDDPQGTIDD